MATRRQCIQVEKAENGYHIALSEVEHGYGPAMLLPKVEFVELTIDEVVERVRLLALILGTVKELNDKAYRA